MRRILDVVVIRPLGCRLCVLRQLPGTLIHRLDNRRFIDGHVQGLAYLEQVNPVEGRYLVTSFRGATETSILVGASLSIGYGLPNSLPLRIVKVLRIVTSTPGILRISLSG